MECLEKQHVFPKFGKLDAEKSLRNVQGVLIDKQKDMLKVLVTLC